MKSEITKEREKRERKKTMENIKEKTATAKNAFNNFCTLIEAAAMGITSGYAIYAGWRFNLPTWGKYVLIFSGVCIALRAFVEFVKFLNRR